MERLARADLEAVLGYLQDIYGVAAKADFPTRAMAGLAGFVGADVITYNEIGLQQGVLLMVEDPPGSISDADKETFGRLSPQHPLIAHYARTQDPLPRRISDFLRPTEFHALELYQDFFRLVGLEHQMAVTIPSPDPVIGIALNRARRDYSERDRSLLSVIRPHLAQAYRNVEVRDRLQEMLATAGRAAESNGHAILLIDRERRVRFAAPLAQRLVAGYLGERVVEGRLLPATLDAWVRQQSPAPSEDDLRSLARPLVVAGEGASLRVEVVSRGERGSFDALLVREVRQETVTDRLTAREADVLRLVAAGKSNSEVADELLISPRTVQKHLEHVYDKLGVRRRTAAARAINS